MLAILKNLMIEQWNFETSYGRYWQACAPTYCTYFDAVYKNSFVGVVITLVSMMGGLIAALRLITPRLVNIAYRLSRRNTREQHQGSLR